MGVSAESGKWGDEAEKWGRGAVQPYAGSGGPGVPQSLQRVPEIPQIAILSTHTFSGKILGLDNVIQFLRAFSKISRRDISTPRAAYWHAHPACHPARAHWDIPPRRPSPRTARRWHAQIDLLGTPPSTPSARPASGPASPARRAEHAQARQVPSR